MANVGSPTAPPGEEEATIISSHPCVSNLACQHKGEGGFDISFSVDIAEPPAGYKNGVNPTENVELSFSSEWPYRAPEIRLRKDFPRNIPHIQPSTILDQEWVEPCIIDERLDSFVQYSGLVGLIDRLVHWLDDVAFDCLRIRDGKWEPLRRDGLPCIAIAERAGLRSLVKRKKGHKFLRAQRRTSELSNPHRTFFIVDEKPYSRASALQEWLKIEEHFPVVLAWSDEDCIVPSVIPDVAGTVQTICDTASAYGCATLNAALNEIAPIAIQYPDFIGIVVLAVRRPSPISGNHDGTDIELLPYLVQLGSKPVMAAKPGSFVIDKQGMHYPATLLDPLTPELARKVSGIESEVSGSITMLGCGSLGSKIAMHLGKIGHDRFQLFDNEVILPHNMVRMGVVVDYQTPRISKADAVGAYLAMLGMEIERRGEDLIETYCQSGNIECSEDTSLIIDSTASPNVHNLLVQLPFRHAGVRLVQVGYHAEGRIGAVFLEGVYDRNPDIEGLKAEFWKYWMERNLRGQDEGSWGDLEALSIGEGCSSVTMVMSDLRASILAAGISAQISNVALRSPDEHGRVSIGVIGEDECSVSWEHLIVKPLISAEVDGPWKVNILADVATELHELADRASPLETGGYLVGQINSIAKRITITGHLAAPADSTSSSTKFVLGVEGAREGLLRMYNGSRKAFVAVGTWHSHPMGGNESSTDVRTLGEIARGFCGSPALSLVVQPDGFRAVVKQDWST